MKDIDTIEQILSEINKDHVVFQSKHDEYRSIRITRKDGNAFARLDIYHNQPDIACLNSLYVNDILRNQGVGTYLQDIRERLGIAFGAKESVLSVKLDSWMHSWYERRGYKYCMDDTDSHVFMSKSLINQ